MAISRSKKVCWVRFLVAKMHWLFWVLEDFKFDWFELHTLYTTFLINSFLLISFSSKSWKRELEDEDDSNKNHQVSKFFEGRLYFHDAVLFAAVRLFRKITSYTPNELPTKMVSILYLFGVSMSLVYFFLEQSLVWLGVRCSRSKANCVGNWCWIEAKRQWIEKHWPHF